MSYTPNNLAGISSDIIYRGSMPKLTAARQRIPSSTVSPPRIIVQGHSVVAGVGATTNPATNYTVGTRETGWAVLMAKSLGWQTGSFFGTNNMDVSPGAGPGVALYDPRINQGSFIVNRNNPIFGTYPYSMSGPSSTDFTFTPESEFDTYTFYYFRATNGSPSVVVKLDGVTVSTVDQVSATPALGQLTLTCALGNHTISIQNTGATGLGFIIGVETRVSTSAAPVFLHGCKAGGVLADFVVTASPWSWANMVSALKPDAVMTECLINDYAGTTANTTQLIQPNLDLLTQQAVLAGADPIWMTDNPQGANPGTSQLFDGTVNSVATLMKTNCASYNGGYGDFRAVFGGSWAMAETYKNWMNGVAHPSPEGHAAMAKFAAKLFQ